MSEADFQKGVSFLTSPEAKTLKVDTKTKLLLYGLYKQATSGPNNTAKPRFTDITGNYKWKAWTACGQMSQSEARQKYVDLVRKVTNGRSKL